MKYNELKVWQLHRIAKVGYTNTDSCARLLYNSDYTPLDLMDSQYNLTKEQLVHISIQYGCLLTEESFGLTLKYTGK